MEYTIIDAHSHLWLWQDTEVDGLPIRTLDGGRSLFMGEIRQMVPPFMTDGRNTAEIFLSNMNYAQVGAAVVTQEYIDGIQNDYLKQVQEKYPGRFLVCGLCEFRRPGFLSQARELIRDGFRAIKIPANRLDLREGRVPLNSEEMMEMFHLMEDHHIILSIDMLEGDTQTGEMKEVIAECPKLKIAIPEAFLGDIMGDMNKRRGRILGIDMLEGLQNAGYVTDAALEARYKAHIAAEKERLKPSGKDPYAAFMPVVLPEEMVLGDDELQACAVRADVAVITIGRGSGEFRDRASSGFDLNRKEHRLIADVCRTFHAAGKKVVVVLNIGGAIETASWKAQPDAILCAWQGGQEGGNSVADILSGRVSPSGKLAMTFPVRYQDHASTENFPVDLASDPGLVASEREARKEGRVENVDYTNYEEDIYVGYRYFDSFNRQVSYPFGYGLSYTTFEYTNPVIEAGTGSYTVRVDVTNTGKVPGREVVQLYVSAPDAAKANKPEKELKAFAKTAELQPGETVNVVLSVNARDLASYEEATSSWAIAGGEYKFLVGASSRDIKATLKADVAASSEKTGDILKPRVELSLLKR